MFRRYNTLPEMPAGYPLDDNGRSLFSVVIPEATTNLVTNPSFELATTGYTAVGASLARSTTQQRRGAYSLSITPTSGTSDGCYYAITLVASTVYTFSCDVYGAPGIAYKIALADNTGAALNSYAFTGRGRWQRVSVMATTGAGTSYRLYLSKNGSASTAVFYTDGWQCEQKAYPTTYCDGDLRGFVPTRADYLWTGTPHGSTSTRSAQCRAGGRVKNLSDFGFLVLAFLGFGMAPVSNVATPSGLLGGAYYQRTITSVRDFSIGGEFRSHSGQQLDRDRASLEDALRHDLVDPPQPVVLRYQRADCGDELGETLEIRCHYRGGLEGNQSNHYQETASITFTAYLPLIQSDGDQGASLGYQGSLAFSGLLQHSESGAWSSLGGGVTGGSAFVNSLLSASSGRLYAGGSFTAAGGTAAASIAYYTPTTGAWSAMSTGANSDVTSIKEGPDGKIYVGGLFTSAGGVANTSRIAYWDPSGATWNAMSTGANGEVGAVAIGQDGGIYIGGDFLLAGGVANTVRIAKWTGSAWTALGSGMNGYVLALAVGLDGKIYAGGRFTTAGGTSANRVAVWDGTSWTALGSGMNNDVQALAIGPDGRLYAGGLFTTAGGVSASGIAVWNGTTWAALGSGLGTTVDVRAIQVTPTGLLYVGGQFTKSGSLTFPSKAAVWNGSAWTFFPATSTLNIEDIALSPSGVLTFGGSGSGTATTSSTTTVTVAGAADVGPILVFTGPGAIYQLINQNTGKAIYFNLTLSAGETATLDLTTDNLRFVSSSRGDISNTILPGSQVGSWRLQAGSNIVELFIGGTTSANTAAAAHWRPQYRSVNGGTP